MTEKTLTSALLKKFRTRYPQAVVIKHHDAGRVGIPDVSITEGGYTLWVEVKLFRPPRSWIGGYIPCERIAQESPVQYDTCRKLAREGYLVYLFLVPRTPGGTFWSPGGRLWSAGAYYWSDDPIWTLLKILHLSPHYKTTVKGLLLTS